MVYIIKMKSLAMNNLFSKSSGLTKNYSTKEFETICDWLRSISQQNKSILNLLKLINQRDLDSSQTYFKDTDMERETE